MCVYRKQCIELEQQFDFLKDLVATVPDMQGEGEENHTEGGGEKVPRRYLSHRHTHKAPQLPRHANWIKETFKLTKYKHKLLSFHTCFSVSGLQVRNTCLILQKEF